MFNRTVTIEGHCYDEDDDLWEMEVSTDGKTATLDVSDWNALLESLMGDMGPCQFQVSSFDNGGRSVAVYTMTPGWFSSSQCHGLGLYLCYRKWVRLMLHPFVDTIWIKKLED